MITHYTSLLREGYPVVFAHLQCPVWLPLLSVAPFILSLKLLFTLVLPRAVTPNKSAFPNAKCVTMYIHLNLVKLLISDCF